MRSTTISESRQITIKRCTIPSGVCANLLLGEEGWRCWASPKEPSPVPALCVGRTYQSLSPEMDTDSFPYSLLYRLHRENNLQSPIRASNGCVYCGTSILSLMSSSFLCKIQLNLSPNKGLQLPFTMRVCHSCNTVHRTGAVLSNCEQNRNNTLDFPNWGGNQLWTIWWSSVVLDNITSSSAQVSMSTPFEPAHMRLSLTHSWGFGFWLWSIRLSAHNTVTTSRDCRRSWWMEKWSDPSTWCEKVC